MSTAADAPPEPSVARATASITAWNAVSRLTGFGRVVATGAALGATSLGDTYQSANLVSNILFELLVGGMLAAVLVPTFVGMVDTGRRPQMVQLAGALLGRALAVLGAVVVAGMVLAPVVMRVLTASVASSATRDAMVELGTFLLWFFLPQVLLYAIGAVATAVLQAEHRFVAAAAAPVGNNLIVIATMIAFRAVHDGGPTLALTGGEKVLLGLGTTAGVLVMTALPVWAAWRAGMPLRPAWQTDQPLRPLARRGAWAAGHLGLNQALVAVTIVVAAGVAGGVIAYQLAFTFFLLPHAVLAHPVFTALYPRLASDAVGGRLERFRADLLAGLRRMAAVLAPATVALVAMAVPVAAWLRVGALDERGARLVAITLAAYAPGLLGYSAFFLLTRAAYALDDVRGPTVVNGWAVVVAAGAMIVAAVVVDGSGRLVALGVIHAAAVTVASVALLLRIARSSGHRDKQAVAVL